MEWVINPNWEKDRCCDGQRGRQGGFQQKQESSSKRQLGIPFQTKKIKI